MRARRARARPRRRRATRRGRAAGAARARRGGRGGPRAGARCGRGSARGPTTSATGASSCPCPSLLARSAAPTSSSSDARSWPTSVTHPSTSPPAGQRSTTARWRSSTSSAGAANGPSSMSQPHVPIVPRSADRLHARPRRRSGWATVPASTTVVTPFCTDSTAHSIADSSSSSGVCAPCSGTDHSKIDAPGGSRSGMQLRTSGSPVRCWWALIIPGVTTHPVASSTSASRVGGAAARSTSRPRR